MVRKEAAWVLANLACGPQEHVDLIVSSGAIDALVYTMREGGLDLKKEAGYALCNLVKDGRALGTVCVLQPFIELRLDLSFVAASRLSMLMHFQSFWISYETGSAIELLQRPKLTCNTSVWLARMDRLN